MGQSTDGILVFGIDLGEDMPEFLEEHENDWWSFMDAISGLADHPDYEKRRKFREEHGADLVSYCSYDYPMYILAINGTERRVKRGYITEIDPESLTVPQEKIDALKKFCEEYDIEWHEPKWLLVSMWG